MIARAIAGGLVIGWSAYGYLGGIRVWTARVRERSAWELDQAGGGSYGPALNDVDDATWWSDMRAADRVLAGLGMGR